MYSNAQQQAYAQAVGTSPINTPVIANRDPNSNDVNYPIGKFWINQTGLTLFYLNTQDNMVTAANPNGFLQSTWLEINASSELKTLSDTANTVVPPSDDVDSPPNNIQLIGAGGITVTSSPLTHALTISASGAVIVETLTGDDGVVVSPSGNNINLVGNVVANGTHGKAVFTASTVASQEKIDIQLADDIAATDITKVGLAAFRNTQFSVDANGFVSLVGGVTPPVIGLTPDQFTGPGTSPVVPNGSGNIKITGGASFATGTQNNPIRTDSTAVNEMELEIQLAGSTAAAAATNKFGVSQFDANQFDVTAGFVKLKGGGVTPAVTKVNVDANTAPGTDPVVADATGQITVTGAQVAAGGVGTNVIRTDSLAANAYTIEIQRTTATGTTTVASNGVAHFDSAAFDVDANGWVQLNGGGIAATAFDVQANTAPGTDPVVPTAAGVVTVNGAAVANHSVVLETRSRAANAYNLEIQYATSAAATDATKSGVAHYNSAQFTVDANGFVSALGTAIGQTITGQSGGALSPTAGNWNIFGASTAAGTSPVVTSGAVSTLTVNVQKAQAIATTDATKVGLATFNSAQFTVDANGFVSSIGNPTGITWQTITASQTLVKNNGYICISAGGALSLALPSTASSTIGDTIWVVLDGATSWTITQAASQQIRFSGSQTTAGATGTLASTAAGDTIQLVYQATGKWNVITSIGNLTVT